MCCGVFLTATKLGQNLSHLKIFWRHFIIFVMLITNLWLLKPITNNPEIQALNCEAAVALNECSSILFYCSLKALWQWCKCMSFEDDSVQELFDSEERTYNCIMSSCTCTLYLQNSLLVTFCWKESRWKVQFAAFSETLQSLPYHFPPTFPIKLK